MKTFSIISSLLFMTFASPGFADIMTFNGTEADGGNTNLSIGFVFTEGDFQYEVITTQAFTMDNDVGGQAAADDDIVFLQNNGQITFTHVGAMIFDASNVDTIGGFGASGTLEFVGHFSGGGTISLNVPVTSAVITNVALPGFVGLDSLDVIQTNQTGNFLSLDNIEFNAIPEPSGLLALGLVGAALISRRRKR